MNSKSESEIPPDKQKKEVAISAEDGWLDRERVVANTGPRITPIFSDAVSIATVALYCSSGTAVFHIGRTDKFIGGAVAPSTPAAIIRSVAPWHTSTANSITA